MIMFHAVAKFLPNVSGGTPLKKSLGLYVASCKKKYKVNFIAYCSKDMNF